MILLEGYLEVALKAASLIALALCVGGLAFAFFVTEGAAERSPLHARARDGALQPAVAAAFLLALTQLLSLALSLWALADFYDRLPLSEFLRAGFVRTTLAYAAGAIALGSALVFLRRRPRQPLRWCAAFTAALFLAAVGARLVHGASRTEEAALLMSVTALHQVSAALWVGGLIHLVALRRLCRSEPLGESLWAEAVQRFSRLALVSMALLTGSGFFLAWRYISGWEEVLATPYGTLVAAKTALLGAALVPAAFNFFLVRARSQGVRTLVPTFAEAEALLGAILLLVAAGLVSHPPAVDVGAQAAFAEVSALFAPAVPDLSPPTFHSVAGFLLVFASLGALLRSAIVPGEKRRPAPRAWLFPVFSLAGGALLLTYAHTVFSEWDFPVGLYCSLLGFLLTLVGAGRYLELRLAPGQGRIPGALWPLCLLLAGLVLLFSRV